MKGAWGTAGLVFVSALLVLPALFAGPVSAQGRASIPPVAKISNPADGAVFLVNQTIYFDGRSSYDPDGTITDWKWIFQGYGMEFNRSQIGVNWSFNAPGLYLVALIVRDDSGAQAVDTTSVIVLWGIELSAEILYPFPGSHVAVNRTVFFASAASLDSPPGELTFRWDFGDGATSTEPNPAHVYGMTGVYTVQLWVRNPQGGEGHKVMGLVVTDGTDSGLLAVISSPANGTVIGSSDIARFWSNGSKDPYGYQMSFLWQFGEDGPPVLFQDPTNVTHRYGAPGTYNVTLLIFDWVSYLAVDRIQVTVVDDNRPPVAVISYPGSSEFPPGVMVRLDAGGSYDPDGDSLTYDWWLNGSMGASGSRHLTGREASLVLSETGSFELALRVTDSRRKSATVSRPLTVREMDWLLFWPLNGSRFETGRLVEFTGHVVFQPVGAPPADFNWSFGDGATAEGQAVQHAYSRPGNYSIYLKALSGNDTYERRGWLLVEDGGSTMNTSILLNGLNETTRVFAAGSSINFSLRGDLWPSRPGVRHQWDLGDGGHAEGQCVTRVYTRSGEYTVSMTESSGNQSITLLRTFTVRPTTVIRLGPALPAWVQYLLVSMSIVAVAGVALFLGGTEIGILALFSFLMFLYTRIKQEEILDNFTRGQIKGYITANPGDHYNSIKQALDLNNGTLAYHLKRLENEGIIKSRADGIYKRFYPYEMRVPEPDGKALTEMQKLILGRVSETPGISQKDIAGFLRVSSGTINYHMETLIKMGRVVRKRDGMKVRYYLVETSFTDVVEGVAK